MSAAGRRGNFLVGAPWAVYGAGREGDLLCGTPRVVSGAGCRQYFNIRTVYFSCVLGYYEKLLEETAIFDMRQYKKFVARYRME